LLEELEGDAAVEVRADGPALTAISPDILGAWDTATITACGSIPSTLK